MLPLVGHHRATVPAVFQLKYLNQFGSLKEILPGREAPYDILIYY